MLPGRRADRRVCGKGQSQTCDTVGARTQVVCYLYRCIVVVVLNETETYRFVRAFRGIQTVYDVPAISSQGVLISCAEI